MSFTDINQDMQISVLKNRIKRLEQDEGRERTVSRLLKELIGHNVNISLFGKMKVLDVDEDWIKAEQTGRKGESTIKLIPIVQIEDDITVID